MSPASPSSRLQDSAKALMFERVPSQEEVSASNGCLLCPHSTPSGRGGLRAAGTGARGEAPDWPEPCCGRLFLELRLYPLRMLLIPEGLHLWLRLEAASSCSLSVSDCGPRAEGLGLSKQWTAYLVCRGLTEPHSCQSLPVCYPAMCGIYGCRSLARSLPHWRPTECGTTRMCDSPLLVA